MKVSDYIQKSTSLPMEQALKLESQFELKSANSGTYIHKEGEVCNKILFIQHGCVSMIYERDNKSFIKDFIFQNDFASVYESFLSQQPARYSLKAVNDCQFQSISRNKLERAFQETPILKNLAAKLTESAYLNVTKRLESLITLSAEQRYLELLERRSNLLSEVPLYLIASYLGITDVALSRIRKKISC